MQIREQGRQVQLIRASYDPVKKRCVQKVIHAFEKSYNYLSDDINHYLSADRIADLSDDEKNTLSAWLTAKVAKNISDDRKISILFADAQIIKSADAILADGIDAKHAAKVWEAIDKLAKALRKAGHPKVSAKALAKPVGQEAGQVADQGDLLV